MGKSFALYGAGKLGISIGAALRNAGERFVGVSDLDAARARMGADILGCPVLPSASLARRAQTHLFAVPDDRISSLYRELKGFIGDVELVVHFSGAVSSRVFDSSLRVSAHPAKALHAPSTEPGTFSKVPFALEGSQEGVETFSPVVKKIGGRVVIIEEQDKPLYHTMCVMSSNLLVGLLAWAAEMGRKVKMGKEELEETVIDLAMDTLSQIRQKGIQAGLSGPVQRGDLQTIKKNLDSLEGMEEPKVLYRLLSAKLTEIALLKGLPGDKADEIKKILLEKKN